MLSSSLLADLEQHNFLNAVGDYTGRIYSCLLEAAKELGISDFPETVALLNEDLSNKEKYKGEENIDDGLFDREDNPDGDNEELDQLTSTAVRKCADSLQHEGFDVDLGMARLSISVY